MLNSQLPPISNERPAIFIEKHANFEERRACFSEQGLSIYALLTHLFNGKVVHKHLLFITTLHNYSLLINVFLGMRLPF